MTLLAARRLSVGYGTVPVVTGLDLEVNPGEVVALLGANGAGKTTALMGLSGQLSPMDGAVEWEGRPISSPLHRRARLGLRYVSEDRPIISRLSTLDNLRLGLGPVEEALVLFPELSPLLRKRAGLLSGGEQKMLSLARALAGQPKIVLADELSLGLAPLVVDRLLAALCEAAKRGIGVLIVEQHIRAALGIANRGYVLRRGVVALCGSGTELMEKASEIESTYLSNVGSASE